MKKYLTMAILIASIMMVTSCDNGTQQAEIQQSSQQGQLILEAQKQCGMPDLVNFQERKMMKKIIEQRDKANLVCYAYLFCNQTGRLTFIGKCMGYGLPYSTQYTNPERESKFRDHTINQPDPNGLYMPSEDSGTWLLMIRPNGETTPMYVEPDVIVSPYKLQ